MSRYDYICESECRQPQNELSLNSRSYVDEPLDRNYGPAQTPIQAMINYVFSSPRIVIQEKIVNRSPYIDTTTMTWWQYDNATDKYVDTKISVAQNNITEDRILQLIQQKMPTKLSELQNDLEVLSSEEIDAIIENYTEET